MKLCNICGKEHIDKLISKYFLRLIIVKDMFNDSERYNKIVNVLSEYLYYIGNTEEIRHLLNELKKTT